MTTTKPISGKPAMNENTPESGPLPELKPCPFCGSSASYFRESDSELSDCFYFYCFCSSPRCIASALASLAQCPGEEAEDLFGEFLFHSFQDAAEFWNRRA